MTFIKGEQDRRCLAAALEDLAVNVAASGSSTEAEKPKKATACAGLEGRW